MNDIVNGQSTMKHRGGLGIDGLKARSLRYLCGLGGSSVAAALAGSALLLTSAAMAVDIPSSRVDSTPSGGGQGIVLRANTVDRGANTMRFYCNEATRSCRIRFECATYDSQLAYEGTFAPVVAGGAREIDNAEIRDTLAWNAGSSITCEVLSEQNATVQQLERKLDGRLAVFSGSVFSETAGRVDISGVEIGQYESALIHSISSPAATSSGEVIGISIFCEAPKGEDCGCHPAREICDLESQVRLSCSEDDGTVYESLIGAGWMPRHGRWSFNEEDIAAIIGHSWEGRGLSCEVRSDHRISVEMHHYVNGQEIANNSASMDRIPVDDAQVYDFDDPLSLPVRAYALAIPSSESRDQASVLMYCNDDHHHCPAWLECTTQSGAVLGKWANPPTDDSRESGRLYRRAHLVIPPRGMHRMSAADIEERITDGSWAGQGRLSCAIRSDKDIRAQVWMRTGPYPPINNTYYVRSEEMEGLGGGRYQSAKIHSVPAPSALDISNIRIHCNAAAGERCARLRIRCSEDDGTVHEGTLGPVASKAIRHIKSEELVEIIGHRWEGIALACEVQADQPFNLQLLTRTGDEGILLNASQGVHARNP